MAIAESKAKIGVTTATMMPSSKVVPIAALSSGLFHISAYQRNVARPSATSPGAKEKMIGGIIGT